MKDYIKRIRRLGADDAVNGEVLNSVVQQLQHNIDLLYGSQTSTRQDKSLAQLLFGNVLDYDQTGYKRFVNGGNMDAIEKVIAFDVDVGTTILEEADYYDGKSFLSWAVDEGITSNVVLKRNIKIPEALQGQKILVAFKVMGFQDGSIKQSERFDVYINESYSGSGDTGLATRGDNNTFKTIYGVYDLGAEETNLEIALTRSIANGTVPSNYIVRVQSVFAGLHTLSNSSYELNFPTELGPLRGTVPDINYFYDFENVSVNPMPGFLVSSFIDGATGQNSSYTINITSQETVDLDAFFVGPVSSGDGSGKDGSNRIDYSSFLDINHKFSNITANFSPSDTYNNVIFDGATSYDIVFEGDVTISGSGLVISDSAHVNLNTDYDFEVSDITVKDSSLTITAPGISGEYGRLTLNNLNVDSGRLEVNANVFSMPIATDSTMKVENKSDVEINLDDSNNVNSSADHGFGFSSGPIEIDNYSSLTINNSNSNFLGHIGFGDGVKESIDVRGNSSLAVHGLGEVSTSSVDKTIKATKYSSVIIEDIQKDGGLTAFSGYDLSVFSSLSTTGISGISGDSVQSYVYEYE
jgi:hypothetical protein